VRLRSGPTHPSSLNAAFLIGREGLQRILFQRPRALEARDVRTLGGSTWGEPGNTVGGVRLLVHWDEPKTPFAQVAPAIIF